VASSTIRSKSFRFRPIAYEVRASDYSWTRPNAVNIGKPRGVRLARRWSVRTGRWSNLPERLPRSSGRRSVQSRFAKFALLSFLKFHIVGGPAFLCASSSALKPEWEALDNHPLVSRHNRSTSPTRHPPHRLATPLFRIRETAHEPSSLRGGPRQGSSDRWFRALHARESPLCAQSGSR
jgi:hypothetical protein